MGIPDEGLLHFAHPCYTVAISVLAFTLVLVERLAQWSMTQASNSLGVKLQQEIVLMKREAARLNTPATFSQSAKLERLVASKEKELAATQSATGTAKWRGQLAKYARTGQTVLAVLAGILLWGQAVAQLPDQLGWPMTWALAWPHAKRFAMHGCISAPVFSLLCVRACRAILQSALPAHVVAGSLKPPAAARTPLRQRQD
eukprot:CAMPEP_0119111958 /NCGR_PEP_ID=MMETSP1180-20130426/38054_1 /TAXON_ID=3052 ORGANISM="Chlamydomonas cf sp, Strain CCMP681" /NCGR_SAMPLE_ID=MMETSP1180 /ASSEMBLY_ACC=CAM_ASM_000741 /LENGTH=200 /DNA_ID=CAMNT_0007099229 /DNA_START=35 /DNA_END=637 /DNA_ORIENTATION=-